MVSVAQQELYCFLLASLLTTCLLTCSWKPFKTTKCLLKNIRGDVLKKLWNSSEFLCKVCVLHPHGTKAFVWKQEDYAYF